MFYSTVHYHYFIHFICPFNIRTTPTSSSDVLVQPDTPTITTTPTNPTIISGEKSLSLNIILGGAKVLLSDTIGDVVSAIVRTISSTIEMKADNGTTIVNARY